MRVMQNIKNLRKSGKVLKKKIITLKSYILWNQSHILQVSRASIHFSTAYIDRVDQTPGIIASGPQTKYRAWVMKQTGHSLA